MYTSFRSLISKFTITFFATNVNDVKKSATYLLDQSQKRATLVYGTLAILLLQLNVVFPKMMPVSTQT